MGRARIAPGQGARAQARTGRGASGPSTLGWAQRLKRLFSIDLERCERCGGGVRIIGCIEDAEVIEKILKHLGLDGAVAGEPLPRAPPEALGMFD
jgi:hypothetical protein